MMMMMVRKSAAMRAAAAATRAVLTTTHTPVDALAARAAGISVLSGDSRRTVSAKATPAPPANTKRVHETPIVENCGGRWMSWLGKGSATQMYCALLFSANMIFRADPAADIYEDARAFRVDKETKPILHEKAVAAGGAISSASACVFFGAKLLCDKIVTDVVSYRNIGDKDEFVRISVLGAVRKQSFSVEPSDIRLVAHDGKDGYKFQVGERQLSLNTATGTCVNRKALEILLQGKPLVTRKGKQSKKRARM